jgi:TetR/AcrR family transcriptional repressor of bet genes
MRGLMAVMADAGYEGATIPAIARAAGVAPGVVHYHFSSKQAILIALIEYIGSLVQFRFEEMCEGLAAEDYLGAFIDANLALGKGANAAAVACWIGIGAESVKQPEVRVAYRRVAEKQLQLLESLCERALIAKSKSTKQKREIALGVLAAIEGVFRLTVSVSELVPKGFAAVTIKEMAYGAVSVQPES